jgi:hypothetical protein
MNMAMMLTDSEEDEDEDEKMGALLEAAASMGKDRVQV